MDNLFKLQKRKGQIRLMTIHEVVRRTIQITRRAISVNPGIILFPEIGALPLLEISKKFFLLTHNEDYVRRLYSSKITALSKAPLGKQIVSLMTEKERLYSLTPRQIQVFIDIAESLPKSIQKKLQERLPKNLKGVPAGEIVLKIADIGMKGVFMGPNERVVRKSIAAFKRFKKTHLASVEGEMKKSEHTIRPLLTYLLSHSKFAKALHDQPYAYVIDEAISRGRTLHTINIVLRSYCPDVKWKIGSLFGPISGVEYSETIDYIGSDIAAPPFSNRPDIIGSIVFEAERGFTKKTISTLKKKIKDSENINLKDVNKYIDSILSWIEAEVIPHIDNSAIAKGLTPEDLIRLLHCMFREPDRKVIIECLRLNIRESKAPIELIDLYIHQPYPFNELPMRLMFRDANISFIKSIDRKRKQKGQFNKQFKKYSRMYGQVAGVYQRKLIAQWMKEHKEWYSKIEKEVAKKI